MTQREVLPDGTIRLSSESCGYLIKRLRPGVLLVKITGRDNGIFGDIPLDELGSEIRRYGPMALFVDTSGAIGLSTPVSEAWTAWFQANQKDLRRVSVLNTSKFIQTETALMQLLSRTGEMIKSYTERADFEAAIAREVPGYVKSTGA